jgi:hypothetical protein
MPITVQWDSDEKSVVRYTFESKWTWDEYHAAIAQAFDMVKDLPYVVNMILDFSQSTVLPSNALSHFSSSMKTPPREFDVAVVISKSGFIETLVAVFRRLSSKTGEKLVVRKSLEEARAYLATRERRLLTPTKSAAVR